MPLNVQNKTYVSADEEQESRPSSFTAPPSFSTLKYFLTGLFIVVTVSSLVFLIYVFALRQQGVPTGSPERVEEAFTPPAPEIITEIPALTRSPEISEAPAYTVFISAYITETPAAEDVSRWNEAGFTAKVVESNGFYSVALGRHPTASAAHDFAEENWEAFEYGYFIGKIR